MAKSRGRKFAELVAPTNGVFAAASIPTIALSKLANSTFSVNSESASLGGNVELDSNDITEHSSALYFTNARADTRADSRIAAHNLLARAGGTMTGNLTLGDNVNAYFGASTDLRIYHDGTNSHIINSTGELRFTGSNFAFKSDSAKLYFGAGDDLQIYHDGLNSYIRDTGTGALRIAGSEVSLLNAAHSEFMVKALENGAVTLYYDSAAKLATASTGVAITGLATMTTGVATSKFAVGSTGVHGSYDFYNNGTGYNNGAFTVDDTLSANNISILGTGILRVGTNQTWSNAVNPSSSIRLAYDGVERSITGHYTDGMSIRTNAHILRLATDGKVHFPAFTFPASDGTSGQVLQTDGSGNLTFVTGGGGAGDITAVVAGTNLTGGATSGSATVNLAGSLTSMTNVSFTTSVVAAPTTSNATAGAKLILHPIGSGRDYAIGIESNTMWFNTDDDYKWYKDGSPRLLLDNDILTFYSTAGNTRGYIAATETDDSHFVIATSNGEDIAFKDNGISGTTNFLIRGDGNLYQGGTNLIWHAGNDGAGSGLDADTLDALSSEDFARLGSSYTSTFGGTPSASNRVVFQNASGQSMNSASGYLSRLECYQGTAGADAFMTFHVSNDYAVYFGLDGATNDLSVGGWSMGATKYRVWHSGNDGAGSGLDADTLDGLQGSSYMGYLGMATNRDDYINLRVIRNSGSSAGSNGMYIGYGNAGSGPTRLYGGGQTSNHMSVNASNITFSGLSIGAVSMAGSLTITSQSIRSNASSTWDGNPGAQLKIQAHSNRWYIVADSSSNRIVQFRRDGGDVSYIDNGGRLLSQADARAPIFYDEANTSYYLDPAASGTAMRTSGSWRQDSTNWTGEINGKIQYHANHWYLQAAGSWHFRNSAGSNGFYVDSSFNSFATGSSRAPIFYDTNDTAYYLDPAGTSRLNYLKPSDISLQGNGDQGTPRWDFRAYVVETPHHYAQSSTQTMYIGEDNTINLRDYAIAEGDMRAPIFYHSTNTGYYVRPGSSSKFQGDIFIEGNYGVGIVGVYSSTRYQHVWMMGASYRTSADGTSVGNSYGLTWTHTNVGTGTNQSISGLSHQLQVRANGGLWCALGQGIWTTGNVTAYSDIAVKTNLEVIPNALEKVCSISGYTYDRTDFVPDPETGEMPETRQAGVVAQEVEKVLPEVVSGEEGNKNVAYGNMVSILIEAIKELKTEVDELKAQLNKEK